MANLETPTGLSCHAPPPSSSTPTLQVQMLIAAQVSSLLQPPDEHSSQEYALELINNRFSSASDLTNSGLLSSLCDRTCQDLEHLNSKLDKSTSDLQQLISRTTSNANTGLQKAQELSLLRHSLNDELTSLSEQLESSTSRDTNGPTLLEDIETLHRNLKELQSIRGYARVIESALRLSQSAVDQIKGHTASGISRASISGYEDLINLVESFSAVCESTVNDHESGLNLIDFLRVIREKTWNDMKSVLTATLLAGADKLHWPMPVEYSSAPSETRKEFESAFRNLLKLQEIALEVRDSTVTGIGLYPLQALVHSVALRFKYHFESDRQTNRLDKPEWYFSHVLNIAHEHRPFLNTVIQELLSESQFKDIDAWREFTRLLLPILERKLRHTVPSMLSHPSLLAHTIFQALTFDNSLRETGFNLKGTQYLQTDSDEHVWKGTAETILGNSDWFDSWEEAERRFTYNQCNEIIHSSIAWQVSEDGHDDALSHDELKPTNSARRIKVLLEQITDRYRPLPRFDHRIRFFLNVQIPILQQYYTRISDSLDAFETLSSFLVRAVPGALAGQSGHGQDTRRMTSGVEGIQRLIKAMLSASWIASALKSWGEDLFFLELWKAIQEKPALQAVVANRNEIPDPKYARDDATVFQVMLTKFLNLEDRAENMIVSQICGEVETALKAHFYRPNHLSDADDEVTVSPTLYEPISSLSSHLTSMKQMLPLSTVSSLYRRIASTLSSHILQRGLLYRGHGRLSPSNGKLTLVECNMWIEACRAALGPRIRRAERPWGKLFEPASILALDENTFSMVSNAVLIGSDQSFQQAMDELGCEGLSREEATDIVRLRTDCPG